MDYTAKHQGKYIDICGVNPKLWKEHLNENGIGRNTLVGGQSVLEYYLDKEGSKQKALLEYKGVEHSAKVKKIIAKILKLEKEYKSRVKNLVKEIHKNEQYENNK